MKEPVFVEGMHQVIDKYDGFIIDLWGVIHNGIQAFPEAVQVLQILKSLKKPVVFLSNAPRRAEAARHQLKERGVCESLYENIYTSGEDCYGHLKTLPDVYYQNLGDRLYHLGPDKDKSVFDDLPYLQVNDIHKASFILNTGVDHWESQLADYDQFLQDAVTLKCPMICVNPDKTVIIGDKIAICAGALAEKYREYGGLVRYHGKPYTQIYAPVLRMLNPISPSRILVIGDSLATDITGAHHMGLDSLFVFSGIHGTDINQSSDYSNLDLFKLYGVAPTYCAWALQWE